MQHFDPNLPPPGPSDSSKRKRPREALDAESDDCLPISKRINCLHLRHQAASWPSGSQAAQLEDAQPEDSPMNPESPPSHFHADMVHSPEAPQLNGHSPQPLDQAGGMHPMFGAPEPVPQNGPHPFAQGGLRGPLDFDDDRLFPGPDMLCGPLFGRAGYVPQWIMEIQSGYKPALSADENPHYYHINQVLYSAHCVRLHRSNANE